MTLHLSRVSLRQGADTAALAPLLVPAGEDARISATHRLVWSLFADGPDRRRDFLWREDGGSAWHRRSLLILSAREPVDAHGLFTLETKPFAPELAPGQRLRFRLRASPGAATATPHGQRGKRVDPLARALARIPLSERAAKRAAIVQQVAADWLSGQGARAGFRLAEGLDADGKPRPLVWADGDVRRSLPRDARKPIRFSSLDLEGELVVEDPDLFLAALAQGFGRAKAFGYGLMLIRRA